MLPLLVTVFIDSLGFGLVFPVFSPLIVGNEGGLFDSEVSLAVRGLLFGILVSTYMLGTFFGGPLLGALSDRKGRKKILVASLSIAVVGYAFAYLGIVWKSIFLLFLARLLSGVAAGNFGVAQSVIADTSSESEKSKNFGLLGMAWGCGFIIGPFIGGKCALLGFEVPFLIAAGVCLINLGLLIWRLGETIQVKKNVPITWGIGQLRMAFLPGPLRGLFGVVFIFSLGWGFFTEFSPIFLMSRLNFGLSEIANYYACVGICIAVCQGLLIRPFIKRFSSTNLLASALLLLGCVLPLMLLCEPGLSVFLVLPLVAFSESFVSPTSTTLVSNLSASDQQGEMLGILNSVQSAGIGLSPLFSGSLVALYTHLPVTVGCACMLLAFAVFLRVQRKAKLVRD